MDKDYKSLDYKSLESKMADVAKTVVAVNAGVYVFEIVCDTMIDKSGLYITTQTIKRLVIQSCNQGKITTTQAANFWSRLGLTDKQVTSLVSTLNKAHEPSGIPYNSGRIRWKTTQSTNPFLSPARKINSAGWERLTDSGTWEAFPPSTSRAVALADPEDQERYTENDAGDLTKDYAGDWTAYDTSDWKGNNDKKGEIDLAKRYAISFSEEATENPKLQRDLREGEVDSPSKIYASELSDSSPTPPFGGRRDSESYQEISPTYYFTVPFSFRESMFGRGVSLLSVITTLGAIVMLVRHWFFKPKKSVVDRKQTEILAKEKEEN